MSDQHFREIQLSGKQLVFLFMASVVLAVSVFLLGVSVGRGVRDTGGPASAANAPVPPPEVTPPDVMPAPTEISERDSAFEQLLPGQTPADRGTPDEGEPPASESPAREAPPVVNEPVEASAPAAPPEPAPQTAAASPPASPRPASTTMPARTPPPTRATTAGQYTVQINAYRSRASADKEAASLKQKGYDAYVDASGGLFRVRIGSYPNKGEADRTAARLRQEGISSLVTR
jgi:cell division protein FtsN